VTTNLDLLARIVAQPDFAAGRVDTGLIERHREALLSPHATPERAFEVAAVAQYERLRAERARGQAAGGDPWSPWAATDAWWNNTSTHGLAFTFSDGEDAHTLVLRPSPDGTIDVRDDARAMTCSVEARGDRLRLTTPDGAGDYAVIEAGDTRHVFGAGLRATLTWIDPLAHASDEPAHAGHLMAPMSGTIVAVMVKPGDQVEQGAALVVLEAMKMEHAVRATVDGTVDDVLVSAGQQVDDGAVLVVLT